MDDKDSKDLALLQQTVGTIEKRVETMENRIEKVESANQDFKLTIVEMKGSLNAKLDMIIKNMDDEKEQRKAERDKTNKKLDEFSNRLDMNEEKGKFDWILFIKTKAVPILVSGGIIYLIINVVTESLNK